MKIETDFETFEQTASRAEEGARVPIEVRVEVEDPFTAYRRARYNEGGFFTVSNDGREGRGYFGVNSIERIEVNHSESDSDTDSFAGIKEHLSEETIARGDCDIPFPCGFIGWASYDTIREKIDIGNDTVRERQLPRAQYGFYDCLASWEEPRDETVELRITACPRTDSKELATLPEEESLRAIYEHGRDKARKLAERTLEGSPETGPAPSNSQRIAFESVTGQDDHRQQVERIQEHIRKGHTNRVDASHHLSGPAAVHPVDVFDSLREINPAPLLSLIEFPGVDIVSANMQLLVEIEDGTARNRYYGGTHRRGDDQETDTEARRTIEESEKYTAEHGPLADLVAADLSRFCKESSVDVLASGEVESFSEIHHLVGRAEGQLQDDVDVVDAVQSALPGPLSGGPDKVKSAEILEEVQQTRRGPYCGALTMFGLDGQCRSGTIIRSLVRYKDEYHIGVGGGITLESIPKWEFAETINKGRALVNAIDDAAADSINVEMAVDFEQKPLVRE
jgi:anthranilate synthase component 1